MTARFLSRVAAAAAAAAALAACGPSNTQVRQATRASGHRTLAVLPFDYAGGERNAAPLAGDGFERRLRQDGFAVADRGKTRNVYFRSLDARTGAFNAVLRDAELGRALGVSAVVVGSCDDAFQRVARSPAAFRWDPVLHRRMLVAPAFTDRIAGLTARVRIIDTAQAHVIWETRYSATLHDAGLPQVTDQVMDVIHEQLVEALLQGRL